MCVYYVCCLFLCDLSAADDHLRAGSPSAIVSYAMIYYNIA